MKKLIAIALTVAMMLTVCVFSASAASAPELLAQGAANVQVGDKYTVSIRLNDASDVVGGFQGELAYTGATVDTIIANPEVKDFNNTDDDTTVVKDDGNSVNFVTVADLAGSNPATRIWFKITFVITNTNPTFTLENVVFSNRTATRIDGTVGAVLAPAATEVDPTATNITLNKVGIIEQIVPNDQAIVVKAGITNVDADVVEYGVVFYPTALLTGELTVDTVGAVKASVARGTTKFDTFAEKGEFSAVLHFNFSDDEKAAKFLGTKVSSRVFFKTSDGKVTYSANSVDKYIQGGVASKAALNTILDFADSITESKCEISVDEYRNVRDCLNTVTYPNDWYQNRCTVLEFAVGNAK